MRNDIDSPLKNNYLFDILNRIWLEGWLNDFSTEHLVKAIYEQTLKTNG